MPSKVFSAAIVGLDAQIVEVETDASYGLRSFSIVGLPDKAVEESAERVGAAIKSSKFAPPHQQPLRILVNLAPADLKKEGSLYDLPIALGYLLSTKQAKFISENKIIMGELSLDGSLRPARGVLSIALMARAGGWQEILLPEANSKEAALVEGIKVIGLKNLKEAVNYLESKKEILPSKTSIKEFSKTIDYPVDLGWIKGQEYAKRAIEIAAAGSHNLFMTGPPGAGKTLLAKAMQSILPPLSLEEILEVTKIYSVVGLLSEKNPIVTLPPFRSPHHSSSEVAIIGGGNPPRPGEITLSHRGVLFLDEFPEFHRDVLESLRQPIEEGRISVLRAKHSLTLPARFILVGASNPCPCGYLNDPEKECKCQNSQVQKYRRKLSGPLIDRIDLFIDVPQLKYEKLIQEDKERNSEKIRERVLAARTLQGERFRGEKIITNAEMGIPQIKKYCFVDKNSGALLKRAVNSGQLSARGYHRVLKVARTIADLSASENILSEHIAEALMYRIRKS